MAQPKPVVVVFWLESALLILVSLAWAAFLLFAPAGTEISVFATPGDFTMQWARADDTRQTALLLALSVLVFGLSAVGMLLLIKMKAGRNWARIALMVFNVLAAVGAVLVLITAPTGGDVVPALVVLTLCVVTVVLLVHPGAAGFSNAARQ